MQLTPVLCSQCGAPLEVPDDVNFVACGHCHVALAVKRDAQVVYTQIVAKLDRRTQALANEVAELRYHRACDELQREWEAYQEAAVFRDKYGHEYEPSMGLVALLGIVLALVLGVIGYSAVAAGNHQVWYLFAAVGLLGGGLVFSFWRHARAYRYAERYYARRIAQLKVEDFLPRD